MQTSLAEWRPVLLCQNFLGHRTHANLLETFLECEGSFRGSMIKFSRDDLAPIPKTILKGLGAPAPVTPLHNQGVDLWAARNYVIQSVLAKRAMDRSASSVDTVYVHSHSAGLVAERLDRRTPLIISLDATLRSWEQVSHNDGRRFDSIAKAMERRMFERADLLISFSDWIRDSLINDYGVPAEKIRTIPNGVLQLPASGIRSSLLPNTTLPLIGFVGNEVQRKGGDLLLECHQRYLSDRSHLVLVTSDRVDLRSTRNVTVLKSVPRDELITSILPKFAVYAHPARVDWSPFAVIEALAAGLPIVSTRVGAIPEMVEDNVNGFLMRTHDAAELAEMLSAILDSPNVASRMSQASKNRFDTRYDAQKSYPQLIATLKSLAGK